MATYKVLQDIEAEDKLVGPLTLKQFIFAIITLMIGFLQFKLITGGGPIVIKMPFIIAFLFPMLIFGFLAAPIGRDQPNETWLLARLRFLFKPHRRVWDQNGLSDLVTITAPKRHEQIFTNNLSQTDVASRLQALANTLDSRGWAIKNVNVNMYAEPGYGGGEVGGERLISPANLPQDVPIADINAADDMMDERNNPTAQHLDQLMQASTVAHRQHLVQAVNEGNLPQPGGPKPDYWFMTEPSSSERPKVRDGYDTFGSSPVVAPGADMPAIPEPTAEELEAIKEAGRPLASRHSRWDGHMKRVATPAEIAEEERRAAEKKASEREQDERSQNTEQAGPPQVNPAIIALARSNDRNISSLAREANQIKEAEGDEGEVVVPLR